MERLLDGRMDLKSCNRGRVYVIVFVRVIDIINCLKWSGKWGANDADFLYAQLNIEKDSLPTSASTLSFSHFSKGRSPSE